MKALAIAVVFILLFPVLALQSAEETGGFAGTWILDQAKSDLVARPLMSLGAPGSAAGGGMGGGMGGPPMGGPPRGGPPMGGPPMSGPPPGGAPGAKPGATPPPPKVYPLIIEQSEGQVKLSVTVQMFGKETPMVESLACDGKEHENMVPNTIPGGNPQSNVKELTKASLKKNKLEVEKKTYYQEVPNKVKRTYTLSKDGNVLTQKTTNEFPMSFGGTTTLAISEQVQVYNKEGAQPK